MTTLANRPNTALLVVDVQNGVVGEAYDRDRVVANVSSLVDKARAADVWPWLLQMGQGRGGFYSYTWLENLVGCQMRNAERIVPDWQDLRVGDGVSLHPKAPPLPVVAIEPGRSIVLGCSWAFVLHPIDERTTRLIVRSQASTNRTWETR